MCASPVEVADLEPREEARQFAEQRSRDAGYERVYAAGLENAGALEDYLAVVMGAMRGGLGPFFLRAVKPGQL
jgi:hypothetical protein